MSSILPKNILYMLGQKLGKLFFWGELKTPQFPSKNSSSLHTVQNGIVIVDKLPKTFDI